MSCDYPSLKKCTGGRLPSKVNRNPRVIGSRCSNSRSPVKSRFQKIYSIVQCISNSPLAQKALSAYHTCREIVRRGANDMDDDGSVEIKNCDCLKSSKISDWPFPGALTPAAVHRASNFHRQSASEKQQSVFLRGSTRLDVMSASAPELLDCILIT